MSFSKEVAPILQQKCVTCHGPEKTKGGFRLHTYENLRQGGESKEPSVTPGDPSKSKLYQLLIARDADDRMPQKDDPLPNAQIELIERWIRQGAAFDGPDPKASLGSLRPPVTHPPPPRPYPRAVPVLALAFSPDGHALAAAGYHEVTIWNPTDGALLGHVTNVEQQTLALAYSSDGAMLAVGGGTPGRSGEARLFELATGKLLQTLATIGDLVLTLAFSPDGRTLAVGGADNVIRIFNVSTGREERRIEQHADWVMSLAFSPDGTRLASASRDKSARLFDTATGELEDTYTGHNQAIFALTFSQGGKLVVTGGRDKTLHAWQPKEAKRSFEIPGFDSDVWRLVAHSNLLFTCSADRQVRIYRLSDKKAELIRTLNGHRDVVYGLAYDPVSGRLASSAYDGEVRIWNTADGSLVTSFQAAPGYKGVHEVAPAPEQVPGPNRKSPGRTGSKAAAGNAPSGRAVRR